MQTGDVIIGTCNLCGGPVVATAATGHDTRQSVCRGCGAERVKAPHGPILQMRMPAFVPAVVVNRPAKPKRPYVHRLSKEERTHIARMAALKRQAARLVKS